MKVSQLVMLGIAAFVSSNMVYAKATSAEVGTLATIGAINKIEILAGVVATNKKPAANVSEFANMMITQHGQSLTQVLELANAMHIDSLTGGESEKLTAQSKKEMLALGALPEPQFDKAYVSAMVKGHQAALDLIDSKLMKTAKTEEMKKFMIATREVVAHHLEDAKKLQTELNS